MIKKNKVLGVTLARGGSKSIPMKNIAPLRNRPLIAYTINEALKSSYIDHYVVSTDSQEIAKVSKELGVGEIIERPEALSSDIATSSDALLHAIMELEKKGKYFDIVVELMATNPLKKAHHIDGAIETLVTSGAAYCVAVKRLYDHHPARIKFLDERGIMQDFFPEVLESRRQDLSPKAYIRAGSIYCMYTDAIKRTATRYDKNNTVAYILPDTSVVNIDEPVDLILAEAMIRQSYEA